MIDGTWRRRLAAVVCMSVAFGALSVSSTGCIRKKATAPGYGPGYEWVDDMRDRIQKNIDDPDKVTGLLAVIDKIELTLIDMDGDVKDYYADLTKLDRDYKTTRTEFQDAIDQFDTKRHQYFEKMLGHMFDMKKIAGKEDWKKVSDIDKTLYENWQRSFES
jgi:hypothetical protein